MSHGHDAADAATRTRALESLLTEKGLIATDVVDRIAEAFERDIGPLNGARVVARAWVDDRYRRRLLEDATAAMAELGVGGFAAESLVAVENTTEVHNVVVCTLCSCYPSDLLGLAPAWYKDPAYRSRLVREPRRLLAEMGLVLPADVEVCVRDSSAEMRYMVLPERPAGSEPLDEAGLAALVTRDALIGVARARVPGGPPDGA